APQPHRRRLEERRTSPVCLHQDPPRARPHPREHQPGHPAATPQVDGRLRRRLRTEGFGEAGSVLEVGSNRAGAQEPELAGLLQNGDELLGASRAGARFADQEAASGVIATRRYGSSPSELVETPSMAFTVSWT